MPIKPSWDPKTTPFVERLEDMGRIYRALAGPVALAYALGAMAGLRTGEILALRWPNVDLDGRRIIVCEQVQDGVVTRPKDKDSRIVPIIDSLLPVLREAQVRTGSQGTVVQPTGMCATCGI
jgi:integrase